MKNKSQSPIKQSFFKRSLSTIATISLLLAALCSTTLSSALLFLGIVPILPFLGIFIGTLVATVAATFAISWIIGKFKDKNHSQSQPPAIVVTPQLAVELNQATKIAPEPKRLSSHAIVNSKTNATTWVGATDEPTPESDYSRVPSALVSEYAPAPSLTPSTYADLYREDPDFACSPSKLL